jgi:hypothetical protein
MYSLTMHNLNVTARKGPHQYQQKNKYDVATRDIICVIVLLKYISPYLQVNTSANTKQAKRVKKTLSQPTAVLGQENLASTGNDAVPSQAAGETDTQASWDQHANYWPQQAYESNATSAPPPAPIPMSQPNFSTAGEDEALSNLMMAWYYSGYYTGYYQAMRRR